MKLTIFHENMSRTGTRQDFHEIERIRLGRHQDNDCVFAEVSDAGISDFHAEIREIDDRIVIKASDSSNRVWVNGKETKQTELFANDHVVLGNDGPAFRVEFPPTKNKQTTTNQKKYGQRTVGMMIQQALSQAGILRRVGTSKSTDYFEAMVENRIERFGSKGKKIIITAGLLLALSMAALGYYLLGNRSVQVYQTTQVNYGETSGGTIAANNRFAIFMLAGIPKNQGITSDTLKGFCSAFAISSNLLVTNAHCIKAATEKHTNTIAIMNGAPKNQYQIIKMAYHPNYREGFISPDVGLIHIRGQLTYIVRIAPQHELRLLAPGVTMFLYGFPGMLNRVDAPEATFVKGDIGRTTTFNQKLGAFEQNTLLQHSAFSSVGTSGSPLFNASGRVIGINSGGYVEDGNPLSGYNFGMRIDLITPLFPMLGTNR
jgi:S1-C subfamily serine protease